MISGLSGSRIFCFFNTTVGAERAWCEIDSQKSEWNLSRSDKASQTQRSKRVCDQQVSKKSVRRELEDGGNKGGRERWEIRVQEWRTMEHFDRV